ncbi:hypothetical protein KZO25_08845 [Halomonas sp. ANAO-440]|uniref:hypothetical protein n=1 Tax=Halomonas sp. ANAO-440 TaxID=2861360 RepID=UPI001CAA6AB6|nr:hypothetical protein [Halomonas sp. ANAO-440]MBZ0330424.1 hypothetical protein [Halomonas sp. ANAO-440]
MTTMLYMQTLADALSRAVMVTATTNEQARAVVTFDVAWSRYNSLPKDAPGGKEALYQAAAAADVLQKSPGVQMMLSADTKTPGSTPRG